MVVLGGITGFRPGMLENLKYGQVALHLALDPRTGKRRPVATFTVTQNKQQTDTVRNDQANMYVLYCYNSSFLYVKLTHKLSADLNIAMHGSLFCIVSLVIARALADNAFDPPVDSLQTLLSRPVFDDRKRLKMKWKADMLNRPIWPISYNTYWRIWTQTTFVAGYPKPIRPYSLRVGAGNRLNGKSVPFRWKMVILVLTCV